MKIRENKLIGLPSQHFLTITELAKRWEVEKSYITYLIDANLLSIGDKHAALNGRKHTVFKGIDPNDFDNNIDKIRQHPDEEIVIVPISDLALPFWDAIIQKAKDATPNAKIPVILMSDILEFEKKHGNRKKHQQELKTKIQLRCEIILEIITSLGYEKFKIPVGGKSAIKEKCLKNPKLFTPDTFDKAWQEGLNTQLFKMANHNLYSNK